MAGHGLGLRQPTTMVAAPLRPGLWPLKSAGFIAAGVVLLLAAAWPTVRAATGVAEAGAPRVALQQARFATGDNPDWAQPDFDDRLWPTVTTSLPWEAQGFPGYDGFAWYRIHVVIPSSLKAASDWPERLRLQLSAIDDADEVYLNGHRVGKSGRMPTDPGGFEGRPHALRDYLVDLQSGLVRWDSNNIIAVRVFDAGGDGGFQKGTPNLSVPRRSEGLRFDHGALRHQFQGPDDVQLTLVLANRFPIGHEVELHTQVRDHATGRVVQSGQQRVSVAASQRAEVALDMPSRAGVEASFRLVHPGTGDEQRLALVVPYVLTPPDAAEPALHGARLLGVRPGTPLHHRIPATGQAPLRHAAEGLPAGLVLDSARGVISGTAPVAGRYPVRLTVSNERGNTTREWTLVVGEQLALTPPMGWNSGMAHGTGVSAEHVRAAVQALLDHGLAAKGWNGVHVDDGWQATQRSADGSLQGNERFPDMAALGRFLHDQGLQFGLYSSPGATTCNRFLGSLGHEEQDAATWAAWAVDHLKYDLCSYADQLPRRATMDQHQQPYRLMGSLLRRQPHSTVYNLCQYGLQRVWTWGAEAGGHSWRMTGDIQDSWQDLLATGFAIAPYAAQVGPGRFNDPDVLMLGTLGAVEPRPTRLTVDEQYSHISLWSLLAAPLILSNHLPVLDGFTRSLLTNSEVVAINQDALGRSALRVFDRNGWQVWVKELEGGAKAVGVFNMGSRFARFELEPALFGRSGQRYQARDAWRQRDLPTRAGGLVLAVPAHGVALLTVR